MQQLTSSMLITKALGLEPVGVKAKEAGHCAYCGTEIAIGDLCNPFKPSPSFMDRAQLAAPNSLVSCGHCPQVITTDALFKTSAGVFTEKGMFPFGKWADIGRALENPPDEPFVMCYATAQSQHMGWRAPVNFSKDLYYVRVGLRNLRIRRHVLLEAKEVAMRIAQVYEFEPSKTMLSHPFAGFDTKLKEGKCGELKINEAVSLKDEKYHEKMEKLHKTKNDRLFLQNLTIGEKWGVGFLLRQPDL